MRFMVMRNPLHKRIRALKTYSYSASAAPASPGYGRISATGMLVLALSLAGAEVHAQGTTAKPIRFVVNIAPGGIVDAVARVVGQKLREVGGPQVIVDNRPGASGNIGAEHVVKSPPDGSTYLVSLDNIATVNANLYSNLTFDPAKDLVPVTMLVQSPLVVVVSPSLPARSMKELVQLARSHPNQVKFASAGSGTPQHFAGMLLTSMGNIKIDHIPYKGSIAAITDVASGQVEMMVPSFTTAMPLIQAGKVRPLAVTSTKRLPKMPELPTVAESGVPGYEVNFWVGMFAPAKTPPETIRGMQQAMVKVMARPEVQERLATDVMIPVANTPEEFEKIIKSDATKWASLIRKFNLKAD